MKEYLINWLDYQDLNVFVTVTLKHGIRTDLNGWVRLNDEQVIQTAWILRDRTVKAIVGKRRKFPFLVFAEGDGFLKRKHLHILTAVPPDVTFREFSDTFRQRAIALDWVYNEIDIRPIESDTQRRVLTYSLKEGANAFVPEASFVPYQN